MTMIADTERPPPFPYGLGWIPDPSKSLIHGHASELLASAAPTTHGCISRLSSVVRDQGRAGSCVGNALEEAFYDRQLAQHIDRPRLGSRLWSYLMARLYGLARDHLYSVQEVTECIQAGTLALMDDGCMIADAVAARFDLGIPPEDAAPYSDALVLLSQLQPGAYQQAHDQRGTGKAYRCSDVPEHRRRDIQQAIDCDYPVILGTQVDTAFQAYQGGVWDFSGPTLGGHAVEVVAYDSDGVWIRNSWSADWGAAPPMLDWVWVDGPPPSGGFCHVDWSTICGPAAGEAFAISWSVSYSGDVPST